MKRVVETGVVWGLLLVSGPALAGSIYLNGVKIDGVTNQKFEKATVKIDEHGNIFIEAPGYAAKVLHAPQPQPQPQAQLPAPANAPPAVRTTPAAEPAPTRITKRYWLVATQTAPGMTEFDIDVYVNAKWLMTLKNSLDQEVVDVTRHLVPGRNTVTFDAKKTATGPRKSFSTEHSFSVVVGEGNEGGGNVMIDNPLVTFKRTAADAEGTSREYTFNTR